MFIQTDPQKLRSLQISFNIRPVIVSFPSYNTRLNNLRTKIDNLRQSYYHCIRNNLSSNNTLINLEIEIIKQVGEKAKLVREMQSMTENDKDCIKTTFYNNSSKICLHINGIWQEVVYRSLADEDYILTHNGEHYATFAEANAQLNKDGQPLMLIS